MTTPEGTEGKSAAAACGAGEVGRRLAELRERLQGILRSRSAAEEAFRSGDYGEENAFRDRRLALERALKGELQAEDERHAAERRAIAGRAERREARAGRAADAIEGRCRQGLQQDIKVLNERLQWAKEQAGAEAPTRDDSKIRAEVAPVRRSAEELIADLERFASGHGARLLAVKPQAAQPDVGAGPSLQRVADDIRSARRGALELGQAFWPELAKGVSIGVVVALLLLAHGGGAVAVLHFSLGGKWLAIVAGSALPTLGLAALAAFLARRKASSAVNRLHGEAQAALGALGQIENRARVEDRIARIMIVDEQVATQMDGKRKACELVVTEVRRRHDNISGRIARDRDARLATADAAHADAVKRIRERNAADLASGQAEHEAAKKRLRAEHDAALAALTTGWRESLDAFLAFAAEASAGCRERHPEWGGAAWDSPKFAAAFPDEVPVGSVRVDLAGLVEGIERGERFPLPKESRLELPLALGFPGCGSLLVQAPSPARSRALEVLFDAAMRVLVSFPPGKAKLTIVDPVGLGQSFAALMHLADHDESLVGARIWTDSAQIERRLGELTEHIEKVIQKYLRNRYASIDDYNREAGELKEAYQFLVVADFPTGFSDLALERLASIVNSGPQCGVFTLIAHDAGQPLPAGLDAARLRGNGPVLVADQLASGVSAFGGGGTRNEEARSDSSGGHGSRESAEAPGSGKPDIHPLRPSAAGNEYVPPPPKAETPSDGWGFLVSSEDFRRGPFAPEPPPGGALVSRLLKSLGEQAREGQRVEVPFPAVAPPEGKLWSASAAAGIRLPIGRTGADRLQYLDLGRGTAQHALIGGRTGSGKSTLFHVIATNAAMWFSPREVELHLIDFKHGVEFKTYATEKLPHARVIAIESDREFGLSVLSHLNRELNRRGDLFRQVGVQDLASYRKTGTGEHLARVLLIIDEFQEFFTEDDVIARDAALLLDRFVRQGRAFGVHVILGSQTLSGMYTLAKSTLGQMGVRIALQCNEADSHLILSEDNGAARLLARPGEAIYNDMSGLVEGNSPFQVVWLSDDVQEACLRQVAGKAAQEGWRPAEPPVIFEGNIPADLRRNAALGELLSSPGHAATAPGAPLEKVREAASGRIWLGEANAIKGPAEVSLLPASGSNLLMLGQHREGALAMVCSAAISLAAANRPEDIRLIAFGGDGRDAESAEAIARLARALPHGIELPASRDIPKVVEELEAQIAAAKEAGQALARRTFLVVFGLQRFPALRHEDDYGLSGGEGASTGERFAGVLRDGPEHGVHSLIWCDTLGNLNRAVSRKTIREFDLRVLFQMSASDSSELIDSAAAGNLGLHNAILAAQSEGTQEKFRPYTVPEPAHLEEIGRALAKRFGVKAGG